MINNKINGYLAYNEGYDVYVYYETLRSQPKIIYKGQELKQYLRESNTGRNYYIVNVPTHGEQYVHKIAAYAYMKEAYNNLKLEGILKPVVDHLDNDPYNNALVNLEWVSRRENALRAIEQNK